MRRQFSPWIRVAAIGSALFALAGCAAPGSGSAGASTSLSGPARPAVALRKGMKPEEVRAELGEPKRVQSIPVATGAAERWVYERGQKTETRQVATGTQEVPYVDPITGQMRTISEPVYADEATVVTEELHLLWSNGELVEWKTTFVGRRSYMK